MTEEEYQCVCRACDALLCAPEATLTTVANPWPHVIREHPIFLDRYEGLLMKGRSRRAVSELAMLARALAGMFRDAGGAYRARKPWSCSQPLRPADVLLVSHVLDKGQGGRKDFYFGALPDELAARGISVAVALVNHSGACADVLASEWREARVPRIVLGRACGPTTEWQFVRESFAEAARLRRFSRVTRSMDSWVRRRAALAALGGGTRAALRIADQLAALATQLKTRLMITTFEGHSWERVAYARVHRARPLARCAGYQHAAVFRLQHGIRRKLGRGYDPDYVLTAGSHGLRQLQPAFGTDRVSILGSDRGVGERRLFSVQTPVRCCLVIPEGIPSECVRLFDFSMRCAEALPSFQFVWRLHPSTRFEKLEADFPQLRRRLPNVRLSNQSFDCDLRDAQCALYRGTTAIVQAVGAGLRPIYLREAGEMTIDPLYELNGWKAEVDSVDDFVRMVAAEAITTTGSSAEQVHEYCRTMFAPFDCEAVLRLLGDHV
jgi:hypothetical protein